MSTLLITHPACHEHDTGGGHPERAARLGAVDAGIAAAGLAEAIVRIEAEPATDADLALVHPPDLTHRLDALDRSGGGRIDGDTVMSPRSWEAARLAAGAGLTAVRRLENGDARAAFCAVRPPGHHARPTQSMGFCLLNNLAITAAHLADRGDRVLVVDIDAHHGNGTQDAFYADGRVSVVSFHEWPLYPGTGRIDELGDGEGFGANLNVCLPSGSTGDALRMGIEQVVAPLADRVDPAWLLVSAGFDAHRADPLTGMGLSSGDYAEIIADLGRFVDPGRMILFLEGGYELDALARSSAAALAATLDLDLKPEAPTSGGGGREAVARAAEVHRRAL